jgi:hypothetical protein
MAHEDHIYFIVMIRARSRFLFLLRMASNDKMILENFGEIGKLVMRKITCGKLVLAAGGNDPHSCLASDRQAGTVTGVGRAVSVH